MTGYSTIASMTAASIISVLIVLVITPVPAQAQEPPPSQQQLPPNESPPDSPVRQLEFEKLQLELEKLQTENRNNERNLSSGRGWLNLFFSNVTILVAILFGFIGFLKYLGQRTDELRRREEERFEGVVKSLGGEREQEQ